MSLEYKTIYELDLSDLDERVNMAIEEGWKPQGGVCGVMFRDKEPRYIQAMTKEQQAVALDKRSCAVDSLPYVKTHHDRYIDISGTHLQGTCLPCVTYEKLVDWFGEPQEGDGYKVDAQWSLKINGIVVTIYNYKTGKNYLGDEGYAVEEICGELWHIGGYSKMAYIALCTLMLELEDNG